MYDPQHLATLAAIHRRGSFERAAAALNLTPSAVSQRLRALEEKAGTLLVLRGPPARASAAGLRLIQHFDTIVLLEQELRAQLPLRPAEADGPASLRIALNADSLGAWAMPALAACPQFLYDLVIDDQAHSLDWLRRGDVAAAISAHPGPLQGCDCIPLGYLRYIATASPAYLARHFPQGISRAGFVSAPALIFNEKDDLQGAYLRAEYPQDPPQSRHLHRIASCQGFVDACVLGMGWGMNPAPMVEGHLAKGQLVALHPARWLDVPLYWLVPRRIAAEIAPLSKALIAAARKALVPMT